MKIRHLIIYIFFDIYIYIGHIFEIKLKMSKIYNDGLQNN